MCFYFRSQIERYRKDENLRVSAHFKPLGYFMCIKLKNASNTSIDVRKLLLWSTDGTQWVGNSEANMEEHPAIFDALNERYVRMDASDTRMYNVDRSIVSNEVVQLDAWSVPLATEADVKMRIVFNNNSMEEIITESAKHLPVLEVNKRYFLYVVWDGSRLWFTDRNFNLPINENRITMSANKSSGETWELSLDAAAIDRPNVWIDLNNNGVKDVGESNINFTGGNQFPFDAQTITIYGKITRMNCSSNKLTSLSVNNCPSLLELSCNNNELNDLDVGKCTSLTQLNCGGQRLKSLNVKGCSSLSDLNCAGTLLQSLDLTGCSGLKDLFCYSGYMVSLKLDGCAALVNLYCYNNDIETLNVKDCLNLETISCFTNNMDAAAVSAFIASLPTRSTPSEISLKNKAKDRNALPSSAEVALANSKNWKIYKTDNGIDWIEITP